MSVLVRLHPTNIRAIQHAFGPICCDTASRQPSAITEGLPNTWSKGGPYVVGAIRIGCWLINVPYAPGDLMKSVPYAPAVGSLMYAMVAPRPHIAYAVGIIRRFMHNPGHPHWNVVMHIFRYLVGTQDHGIKFGPNELENRRPDTSSDSELAAFCGGRNYRIARRLVPPKRST
jgi:hypothetical protein